MHDIVYHAAGVTALHHISQLLHVLLQSGYSSWKLMEFKIHIFRAWKVMELGLGPKGHEKSTKWLPHF